MACPGSTSDTKMQISATMLEKTQKHPCYSFDAHKKFARMHLPVAPYCKQCRADAIGLLGEDRSQEFRNHEPLLEISPTIIQELQENKIKVAVTSRRGKMVNLHFGQATEFLIYEIMGIDISFLETRPVDKYCLGMDDCDEEPSRREALIDAIADCDAVLTMKIGYHVQKKLLERGIVSVEYYDTVEQGLRLVRQTLEKD